ncbi:MAG: hypothetical protein KDK04_05415, partial [Candidatus Competibacteraceae bacterium]|nr:hypothetical protein [Candidatus Competibacteraceae bacterium]
FEQPVFDQQALGWRFSVLEKGKAGVTGNARTRVYDTTLPGYSNTGHTFGDVLEDAQRQALLEYLKTL